MTCVAAWPAAWWTAVAARLCTWLPHTATRTSARRCWTLRVETLRLRCACETALTQPLLPLLLWAGHPLRCRDAPRCTMLRCMGTLLLRRCCCFAQAMLLRPLTVTALPVLVLSAEDVDRLDGRHGLVDLSMADAASSWTRLTKPAGALRCTSRVPWGMLV